MMLAKPKPDDEPADNTQELRRASPPLVAEATEDREKELERRLALLGNGDEGTAEAPVEEKEEASKPPPMSNTFTKKEDPFQSLNAPVELGSKKPEEVVTESATEIPALVDTKTAEPIQEKKPAAPAMNNKSALLARIKLVQERAKQAQMKQAPVMEESEPTSRLSEKEKMMKALNGETEVKKPEPSPPTMMAPPPPPFEIAEQQQQPATINVQPPPPPFEAVASPPPFEAVASPPPFEAVAPPPPFEAVQQDILTPSAPPVEEHAPPPAYAAAPDLLSGVDHLSGITPVMAPPPTFESIQQQQAQEMDDTDVCDFDIDGNKMTHEEKVKMMEEQRAIMEQIKKESNQNSASEAAAKATAFELRSNTAAAEAAAASDVAANSTDTIAVTPVSIEGKEAKVQLQSIDIGGGRKVALHGQEKTRAAILNGTAILVKCVNCASWMQVTETATLMFCPVCSVVSPVIKQDNVFTMDEARQLEADRKLAEKLQNEEDGVSAAQVSSDYPAVRRGATQSGTAEAESSSWLGSLLPASIWSGEEEKERSAEISMSRPPGAAASSSRGLYQANAGTSEDDNDLHLEQESLISNSSQRLPSGRVAEAKPLFSCVVDSISDTANAFGGAISHYAKPGDGENVHGVDTTSFLSVTNAERDGGGDYRVVPDRD